MTMFRFDARASLEQARQSQPLPTLPTLPTNSPDPPRNVGKVGNVGRGREAQQERAPGAQALADAIDHYEERAAIREYDGGQSRQDAEAAALAEAAQASGVAPERIAAALDALRAATNPTDAQRILARCDGLLKNLDALPDPLDSVRATHIRNLARTKGADIETGLNALPLGTAQETP